MRFLHRRQSCCGPRLVAAIAAAVLATAGCSSQRAHDVAGQAGPEGTVDHTAAAPPPARPASPLEQVQRSAPPGVKVERARLTVPGVELFLLTAAKPLDDDDGAGKLVGVVGGLGGKVVEGSELVRAAIDGKPDHKTLARLALWAAQRDGDILDAPGTPEQRKARVVGPKVRASTLTFWVWTSDVPRALEKARLDLTTGALELVALPMSHDKAIDNAIATLFGVSVARHPEAIKLLAAACAEPTPQQALLSALASHPRARTRAAVADEVHRCGAAAVEPLVSAMAHDRSALVRSQAATALGQLGDKRARPALAKAARSEDPNLAWAASNALKKLE